jgi:hypothetical protein
MALQIRTQPAILAYKISKPEQNIQQPKAQVEGSISHAKIRVEGTTPRITIDQTQAFNESGLKNIEAFAAEYVQLGKQKMQESAGRIAEQGDQLSDIHLGGNPIADQAMYNAFDQFYHEFGMVTMPRSGPAINVIEGRLDIQVTEGQVTGQIRAQKPIVDYKQGRIERYMKQYNSIEINYVGEKVDLQV